jgi:hypothetical protein
MEDFVDIELNECIVCQDYNNEKLIEYKHKCGKYYIHKKCLKLWFKKHNNECIICRDKFDSNIENNKDKQFCFYLIIIFSLFIIFSIILLFYLMLFI